MSFLNNESSDVNSNTGGLPIPSVPKHRPIRKAYTSDATFEMASSKPQRSSTDIMEGSFDNGVAIPPVPLHRPVRRTTTDEINNLIRNTNEELEQMEKLVTRHTHTHHSYISKTQDTTSDSSSSGPFSNIVNDSNKKSESPVVPQRPHSNKLSLLSYIRNDSQSQGADETKIMKTTNTISLSSLETSVIDIESNKFNKDKGNPELPQVPSKRPVKRQSSLEPNELPITNPFFDNNKNQSTLESVNVPMVPKQRPTGIKKMARFNKEDVDLIKKKLTTELPTVETSSTFNSLPDAKELSNADDIKQDIKLPDLKDKQTIDGISPLVIKKDSKIDKELEININNDDTEVERPINTNDNAVVRNETVEIKEIGDKFDHCVNNNNIKNNETAEDIKNTENPIEPLSNMEENDSLVQNIAPDNEGLESSNVEEKKRTVEDTKNEKSGVELLVSPRLSNLEKTSSLISTAEKSNKGLNSKDTEPDISVESHLKYNLQGNTKLKDNQEPFLEKEKNVNTDESLKTEESNIDSTAAVNKNNFSNVLPTDTSMTKVKPQVPLLRPQKGGPPPVPKKPSSKIAAFHEMLQKQQVKDFETQNIKMMKNEETGKQSPMNRSFIDSLNNLVALPGMTPPNTNSISNVNNDNKVQDSNIVVTNDKIESNKSTTKKELHDLRQRRSRGPRGRKLPSSINNMTKIIVKNENYVVKVRHLWSLKCKANNFTAQTLENSSLIETEKEKLNDQQNDVSDTESQKATKEHPTEDNLVMTATSNTESEKLLNSTTFLTNSILSRNDYNDDAALRKEKDFEVAAEEEMQKHLMEKDEVFADCISDAYVADSRTSTEDGLEPVTTDITEEDNINSNST